MEDEKIIEMLFGREQEALGETERKYGRYLHTIAMRILGNREDSEECVNDTLLAAWNSIPPARPGIFAEPRHQPAQSNQRGQARRRGDRAGIGRAGGDCRRQ